MLVVSRTGKTNISLSLFAPENYSSKTGSVVPSRVSLLILIILSLNLVLTRGIPPDFHGGVHLLFILNHHTPSGQSRVYRSRNCSPMAFNVKSPLATGPVVLNVVPVTGAVFASL